MRKFFSLLTSLMAAVALTLSVSSPASAATYVGILSQGRQGMTPICATPEGNGTSNGTIVTVWTCTGSDLQQWSYDGLYLKNLKSGKCLTPQGDASGTPGTVLTLWTCTNASSQRFVATTTLTPTIYTEYGGMCITDKGDSQHDGTWLTLWSCNSSYPISQQWEAPDQLQ